MMVNESLIPLLGITTFRLLSLPMTIRAEVFPLLQGGFKEDACARVNPVVIDGKTIMLESQTKYWQNLTRNLSLSLIIS